MKKICSIVLLLLSLNLVMTACGEEKSPSSTKAEEITPETPETQEDSAKVDSTKIVKAKNDSVLKELESRNENLKSEVTALGSNVDSIKKEFTELKESKEKESSLAFYFALAALVVSLLTFAFAWLIKRNAVDKEEAIKISKKVYEKMAEKEQFNQQPNTGNSSQLTKKVKELQDKLDDLERKYYDLNVAMKKQKAPVIDNHSNDVGHVATTSGGTRYARKNNQVFFPELFASNDGTCNFIIDLKNDTEGTFDIISIEKLRNVNGWEQIVDYDGYSKADARSHKTISKGKCVKSEGRAWKVTQKLKITLLR